MYRDFFGFDEDPFRITPDPRFLHVDPVVEQALDAVAGGIDRRAGLILLVGEVGTGKTTLVRRLLDLVADEARTVLVLHPTVSFDEILDHVLLELGLPVAGGGREELLERLAEFLREHAAGGGNVAVFFDEAQALRDETLASLPLLLDLAAQDGRPGLQVILAGQPELSARLAAPELEPVRRRVAVTARLGPLAPDGVRAYVRARLARAGAPDLDLFADDALDRLSALSGGVPRLINVLCEAALVAAFADGQHRVGAPQVEAAWADYAPLHRAEGTPMPAPAPEAAPVEAPAVPASEPAAPPARHGRLALAAAAIALVALLPFLTARGRRRVAPEPRTPPPSTAPVETADTGAAAPAREDATPVEVQPPAAVPPPEATPPGEPEPIAAAPEPARVPEPPSAAAEVTGARESPPRAAAPAALEAIAVVDRFWEAYRARDDGGMRALLAPEAAPPGPLLDVDPTGGGALVTPTGRIEARPAGDRVAVRVPFQLSTRDDRGRAVRRQGIADLQVAMRDGALRIVGVSAEIGPLPRR